MQRLIRFAPRAGALLLAAILSPNAFSEAGVDDGQAALPLVPVPLTPAGDAPLPTERPGFEVRNAAGYDQGQAVYTFRVAIASNDRELATISVAAGNGTTRVTFPGPLLRGTPLKWTVVAESPSGRVESDGARFLLASEECESGVDPWAKSVVSWWIPACSLAENHYDDPNQALGPPDLGGHGPDSYSGFVSLGFGGWVAVDMGACAVNGPGTDVRVFQSVSGEPVTLYASTSPEGPWVLINYRLYCGFPSDNYNSNHCDFDLGAGGVEEARYLKVEDGELFPCPGDTVTEGADLDAIQLTNQKP